MAVLFFAGAEIGSTDELSSIVGTVVADTAVVRTGKYAYKVSPAGSASCPIAIQTNATYFRGYLRLSSLPASDSTALRFKSGGSTLGELKVTSVGVLKLTGGATLTGTTVIGLNVWHRIELRIRTAGSAIELRLNGRRELQSTSFTMASGVDNFLIEWTTGMAGFAYWDDLHIDTDDWPGPGFVIARQGTPGTPAYNAWTKTGGAIDVIWSATPFSAAAFAASTAASQTQTVKIEKVSECPRGGKYGREFIHWRDTVLGSTVCVIAKRGASASDHAIAVVIGGALSLTTIATTTTDAFYRTGVISATSLQLDSAEMGGARVAGSSNMTIEDCWLMVSVKAGSQGLIHFSGFETGGLTEHASTAGTAAITSVTKRTGGYAAQLTGAGASISLLPPGMTLDQPILYARIYCYLAALPGTAETVLSLRSSLGSAISLRITPAGSVQLMMGTTNVGTANTVMPTGQWVRLELKGVSDVLGAGHAGLRIVVGVAEEEVTWDGDTAGSFQDAWVEARSVAGFVVLVDDCALSTRNWIGNGRCIARQGITGTPADPDFTLVGGAIDVVWSNTPLNAATYAEASGATQEQTMALALVSVADVNGRLIGSMDCVVGCRVVASARLVSGSGAGGPHSIRRRVAGVITDTPIMLDSTTARLVFGDIWQAMPATIDAVQVGAAQGASTPLMRVEDVWLMVEYAELIRNPRPAPSARNWRYLLTIG